MDNLQGGHHHHDHSEYDDHRKLHNYGADHLDHGDDHPVHHHHGDDNSVLYHQHNGPDNHYHGANKLYNVAIYDYTLDSSSVVTYGPADHAHNRN